MIDKKKEEMKSRANDDDKVRSNLRRLAEDGSNDTYRVNGKDFQLGIKRYFPNKDLEHAVEAKALACDILIQISRLETD